MRTTFRHRDWLFVCNKGPIWGAKDFESASGELLPGSSPLDHIPDAFFGHNYLEVHYTPRNCEIQESSQKLSNAENERCDGCPWCLTISPIQAAAGMILRGADPQVCFPTESLGFFPASLRVKQADAWQRRVATEIPQLGNSQSIAVIPARYDWTCTSKYWGKVSVACGVAPSLGVPRENVERCCSGVCGLSVVAEAASPQDDEAEKNQMRKIASVNRVLVTGYSEREDTMGSVSSLTTASDHPYAQDSVGSPGGVGVELKLPTIPRSASDPPDLPLPLLKDTRLPILWLQQCEIFSDDLSDSGTNRTDVRIRVMPSFWFILYRQQIRVDDVALRQIEVRFFHAYDTHHVTREVLWMEATYPTLIDRYRTASPYKASLEASGDVSASLTHKSFGSSTNRHLIAQFRPEFDGLVPAKDTMFRAVQFLPLYDGDAAKSGTTETTGAKSPQSMPTASSASV